MSQSSVGVNILSNEISIIGESSTVNSTSTPLGAGLGWTGTTELNEYNDAMITIKADQNGTIYCDFSPDGTNWDSTLSFNYDTTRINPPHVLVKGPRYYRTRFTNTSATGQTYMRLNTYYGSFQKLTAPINGTLSENYDAIVVRPTDYHYEVAMSKRQGSTTWNKFGYNLDVDIASGYETIWSPGGSFQRMTSATTLSVNSTSADDTSAGTGAQSIVIYGVDGDYLSKTSVVSMDGTSIVTVPGDWRGINRAAIYLAGSGGGNAGRIGISGTSFNTIQGELPVSAGTTQQAIFFTQANHTALMDWLVINVVKIGAGSKPVVTVKGWVISQVSGARYEVFRHIIDTEIENTLELNPSQPFVVGEKSVFYLEANTDIDNTSISARFSLIEQRIS